LGAGAAIAAALAVATVSVGPVGAATALPGAPTITSVTPGPLSITVAFKPPVKLPTDNFLYVAVCSSSDGGRSTGEPGIASPLKVTGLTGGRTYVCRVRVEHNDASDGPWSPKSATVVPLKEQKTTVPDPPKVSYVHAGKGTISVGFVGLGHSGGLKVTRYMARCVSSDGGNANKQQGTHSPIVVDHLAGAKSYTCRVAARNRLGFGAYSAASKPVKTLPL
jgi:hypothetical protein